MNELITNVTGAVKKNSATILTVCSIAGLVTAVGTSMKSTSKATQLIEDAEREAYHEGEPPLTGWDKFRITLPVFLPTYVMTGVTIGCIIGNHKLNMRRTAALASAYTVADTALREYQSKVHEIVGEKKAQAIQEGIYTDRINSSDGPIFNTGDGTYMCYDNLSGRFFRSDREYVRACVNDLNDNLYQDMAVSLNQFYTAINLPDIESGDILGWNVSDGAIKPKFTSMLSAEYGPVMVVDFEVQPGGSYF